MGKYVAVAGKGGVGKTTFITLMLRQMVREKTGISILAVDADPNANLNEALGLTVTTTISDHLEEIKNLKTIPDEMRSTLNINDKFQQALIKSQDLDLLVMGDPQGPGCYCVANNLLRMYIENLGENYDFVAVDTEAGMEHFSRFTIPRVDILFIISDTSARGIRSARRVYDLIRGLQARVGEIYLIVTQTVDHSLESLADEITKTGLQLIGDIPLDPLIFQQDVRGKALFDLPDEAVSVKAVDIILRQAKI